TSRRRCCAWAATTPPTRRRGWSTPTSPTSTGCSTPSTGPSSTDGRAPRERITAMSQSPSSSSIVQIKLTDPGEGLTEAEIIDIKVSVGDTIAINDAVIEVETAKSAVELPSHVGGTEVPAGTPLLEGDTAGGPAPAPEEPDVPVGEEVTGDSETASAAPAGDGDTPAAAATGEGEDTAAEAADAEPKNLVGYGSREQGPRRRRRRLPAQDDTAQVPIDRILAKPPVRKLARDLGVALADILATGPGGTVTRE